MKRTLLILLFTVSSLSLIAQDKTDLKSALTGINDWHKVKDAYAAYIINFPNQPEKGLTDVPTEKGTVKMHTYTLQSSNDANLVYMSSYTKYPNSFFPNKLESSEKQNEVLDNSVDGAVTNTNGSLVSEKKIVFNGYRGRMIKIALEGDYIIQMKVVLVGIKLYLAQVIYQKEDEGNKNANRFFDSFELINVKQ
ncbi:hypothetical protein [uncultured Winogradskyella sp.]|uniref:hypothetical protein n=1 Tax=uncultured Winogradskyella sp. TaxID=395353 RepID=UPI0026292439|nr:hypothetical protein [uncultured Winogradskyella sp.]